MARKNRIAMPRTFLVAMMAALLAALLAPALTGCGYSLRKGPAVRAVRIEPIANNTNEPRLQDFLYDALVEELMKQGVRVRGDAEHGIEGALNGFELRPTAEKEDVTVQYEVAIHGRFSLVGPDGSRTPLRERGAFIVTFGGEGALELLTAGKELAIQRALRDMAREIAASLVQIR